MDEYFPDKKNNKTFKKIEQEVKSAMLSAPMISGFDEEEIPYFEQRYFLLKEGITEEEKRNKLEKIRTFNETLNLLNQAKIRNSEQYGKLKDHFVNTFIDELGLPENKWIIDRFELTKSHHKRTLTQEK